MLKVADSPLEIFRAPLVPKVPTLQIKLVGFDILGVTLGQPLFVFACELQRQRSGHSLRNGILHGEDVCKLLVESLCPQWTAISDAYKLHSHADSVIQFLNASFQHCFHLELAAGCGQVLFLAGILTHCTRGPDDDLFQITELGDQGIGHTQFQVFVLRILVQRFEGKHRNSRRWPGNYLNLLRLAVSQRVSDHAGKRNNQQRKC